MPEASVYRADSAVFFDCEATHPSGANTTHTSVTATVPLETLPDFEPAGEAVLEASLRRRAPLTGR